MLWKFRVIDFLKLSLSTGLSSAKDNWESGKSISVRTMWGMIRKHENSAKKENSSSDFTDWAIFPC